MPRLTHQTPVVIRTRGPLTDWRFRIAGVVSVLGVLALGASLDDPAPELEDPVAAYTRGVQEGHRQMQAAQGERSTLAYQRGLADGGAQCAKGARP